MKGKVDERLAKMGLVRGKAKECHWRRRVHYVPKDARALGGWTGPMLQKSPVLGFAIDRLQRIRQIGLLSLVNGPPQLFHVRYEPMYFEFEWAREQALAKEGVTEVVLYDGDEVGDGEATVALPPAETMAAFDTLEMDLAQYCKGHDDQACAEWDCKAWLSVLVDGEEWEIGRWITSYHREGRRIADISHALPLLKGGDVTFRFHGGNTLLVDLKLRLRNAGKPARPTQLVRLFGGGDYNAAHNDKYTPLEVPIPASAKQVSIVAYITGHGFGVEKENCAEFCDHTHHFTIGGLTRSHSNPNVGSSYGCAKQVVDGTVPNQFGTWTLGRGGWCPGMDVKPFVGDFTAAVTPGQPASVTYQSLFEGEPYVPEPYDWGGGGCGSSIWRTSYLVVHE